MFIELDNGKDKILVNVCEVLKIMTHGKNVTVYLRDGTNEHVIFDDTKQAYEFVTKTYEKLKLLNLA